MVLGVSGDTVKKHASFKAKYNLPFGLLVDADTAMAQAYDIMVEKSMYGKKYIAPARTTFLIDPEVNHRLYEVAGFKVAGKRAVRVDILERLADIIRPLIALDPKNAEGPPREPGRPNVRKVHTSVKK